MLLNHNIWKRMVLLMLVMSTAVASVWADTWDGGKSLSLSTKKGTTTGAGSATNPYLIQSAKDFAYLMIDKAGQSWYVELTADLDMDGANRVWTGGQNKTYKGHFDGKGYTISNVRVTFSASGNYGVFGSITGSNASNKAEVKNVKLDNITLECTSAASISYNGRTGAVAGYAKYAVIDHVKATNIKATYNANVGITGSNTIGGLIGYATDIVDVTDCTVDGYEITIQGATTGLILGGLIGQTTNSGTNSSINVIGNTVKGAVMNITTNASQTASAPNIGGLIGFVNSGAVSGTPAKIYRNTITKSTTAAKSYTDKSVTITINGLASGNFYVGGFIGQVAGKGSPNYRALVKANTVEDVEVSHTNATNAGNFRMGGFIGFVGAHCDILNNTVTRPQVKKQGAIKVAAYVGGAIGYTADYSVVDGLHVYGGSITGPTTTAKINNNVIAAFGGVLGYKNTSANTYNYQVAVFKNIVINDFNIDLGNYTSADGKIQNWKYYVGGVIGTLGDSRIGKEGTTSSMPENLVSKGVKIYAPMAMVAPFVANFQYQQAGYTTYFMHDRTTLDDIEKSKVASWVYNDFKVGLSGSVQSNIADKLADYNAAYANGLTRRNYDAAQKTTVDGVDYISVDNLKKSNRFYDFETDSKTVLWWTKQDNNASHANNDIEQNIYPNSGNTSTGNLTNSYPYWMYFYQGVNYGTAKTVEQLTPIINGIDANIAKAKESDSPVTLTITDAQDKARGFDTHSLAVAASDEGAYTYNWYVDGVAAGTDSTLSVRPDWKYGKSIIVNAVSGGDIIASACYTLRHGVLKTRNSADISTDYIGMPYTDRGTEDNPYIIDCPEALKQWSYLSTYPNAWYFEGLVANGRTALHWNRAWFELGADIDLNHEEFTPISHVATASNGFGTYNQNSIFCGHFDGKGYAIRNFKVTWAGGQYNGDGNQYFGLFGAVGWGTVSTSETCVIQNLVIDNANFEKDPTNTSFAYNNGQTTSKNNLYIGALAGIVSNRTTIQNIEVRNSKITDDGSSAYNLQGKIFSAGGMVGRVQTTAVSNSVGDLANNVSLKFLSADCDIELTHAEYLTPLTSGAQMRYFNIGGVVGSLKTTGAYGTINMPEYAYYTGKINSPNAIVGPVFASVDFSGLGDNYSGYWQHYMAKTNAAMQEISNVYYGDYRIQDYSTSPATEKTITDSYPAETCVNGERTITPHNNDHPNNATFYTDDNYYGEYQGVNYGEYIHTSGEQGNIEVLFEEAMNAAGIEGYYLIFTGNQMRLEKQKPMKITLLDNTTDASATSHNLSVICNQGTEGYTFTWYVNGNPVASGATTTYPATIGTTPQLIYVVASKDGEDKNTEAIGLPRSLTGLKADYTPKKKKDVTTATATFTVTPTYHAGANTITSPAGYTLAYKWEEFVKGSVSEVTYDAATAWAANKPHVVSITKKSDSSVIPAESWTAEMSTSSDYTVTYETTISTVETTITQTQYDALSAEEKTKCTSNGDGNYTYIHDVEVTYTPVKSGDKYQSSTPDSWSPLSNTADSLANANKDKTYRCTITATDSNWKTFVAGITDSSSPYYALRDAYPSAFTYEIILRLRDRKVVYLHPVNSSETFGTVTIPAGSDADLDASASGELGDRNHPVATWGKAYSLLDGGEGVTWDDNIIVLVGKSDYQTTFGTGKIADRTGGVSGYFSNVSHYGLSNVFVRSNNDAVYGDNEVDHPKYEIYKAMIEKSPMGKNVTITGKWYQNDDEKNPLVDYNAMIESPQYCGRNGREFINFYGNTKMEYLTIRGYDKDYDGIFAHYHDLWFGEGLIMKNFVADDNGYGTIATVNTPRLQVFGGMTGDARFNNQYDAAGGLMDRKIVESMPNGEKGFTITVRSGFYSIICSGSRQTSNVGLQGSPNRPIKCTIDVDIDQEWNLQDNHDQTMAKAGTTPYDIALIMAGNHEGAMYADVDIWVKSGRIARIVNGSLGAIRNTTFKYNGVTQNYPMNTYMGRANILLDPASSTQVNSHITDINKRVIVTELYNGSVGRSLGSDGEIDMPSLGKNTLTMKGGTIGYPAETTNWKGLAAMKSSDQIFPGIYGGGAGGMNGIGWDEHHTKEERLPYWTDGNKNVVLYGNYEEFKTARASNIFTIKCYNTDTKDFTYIDPLESASEIHIEGGQLGTAESPINVFGGGSGFTSTWFLRTDRTSYPCTQAGNMYGQSKDAVVTTVNISGGEIYGNVYGAGKGTDYYYTNYRSGTTPWGQTTTQAAQYTALGQTYGSVVISISGNAVIHGNVYGAGAGVAEAQFVDKSKYTALTETALLAGDATIHISGNTHITGNIYGGGMLARVDGNTTVNISGNVQIGGNVFGAAQGVTDKTDANKQAIHGTTEKYLLHTADNAKKFGIVGGNATLSVSGSPVIGGDIYGGAESAVTQGSTTVTVDGGTINDIYGGGYGSVTSATTGAASADVWGNTTVRVTAARYDDNGRAEHYIYGGGNLVSIIGHTTGEGEGRHTDGGMTSVTISTGIAMDSTTVFGGGNGAGTQCEYSTVNIRKFTGRGGLSSVYGGGNQGVVNHLASVNINGGQILREVFGGGNEATVGETSVSMRNAKEQTGDEQETEIVSDAIVYGNIYGGGNKAAVLGNTSVYVQSGRFGGDIFGGGNGELYSVATAEHPANTPKRSADVDGKTTVSVVGATVIWNRLWDKDSKTFVDWSGANAGRFVRTENGVPVFLTNHNIYGGGNAACVVADTAIVDVTRGFCDKDLLGTSVWRNSFNDNLHPHFYVFGGGYGAYTRAKATRVSVGVMEDIVEDATTDEQLAPGRRAAQGDVQIGVYGNNYGIPGYTVLGIVGGGYAGLVDHSTDVSLTGNTFVHRVFGGGYGLLSAYNSLTASDKVVDAEGEENDRTRENLGEVGDYTRVHVTGGYIYGDIFGGGAGVESVKNGESYTDFVDMGRVGKATSIEISDRAQVYGNVYGGGDVASVGKKGSAKDYTEKPQSATAMASVVGTPIGYTATADRHATSYVNILGGDIFGEVFAGGRGRKKAVANDYTLLGRIEGNTLLHVANWNSVYTLYDPTAEVSNSVPYIWNRIYGGGSYGTVDGNTLVHIEGGMLGLNIFGGGYGDIEVEDDETDGSVAVSTSSSTLNQVLGKADTDNKGTYANVLGNTKVQIDGGSWIWNRKADSEGNVTAWEHAGTVLARTAAEAKALMVRIRMASSMEQIKTLIGYTDADREFFDLDNRSFKKNHNIFGGGNRACMVGTYSDGNIASSDVAAATNTGKAEVIINHSPVAVISNGNGGTINMLDATTLGSMCWYLSTDNVAHPQFSVFGAGYGANTKVGATDVRVEPGTVMNDQGTFANPAVRKYVNEFSDLIQFFEFENSLSEPWDALSDDDAMANYGGYKSDPKTFLRFRDAQLAWSLGAPNTTFMDIHGGGFSGYVQGSTSVTTNCQLACRNVFGAGLGAKPYGEPTGNETLGQVGGNSSVLIKAGYVSLNVYGGGAGVESVKNGEDYIDFPNIARVKGKTEVRVEGKIYNTPSSSYYIPERVLSRSFERTLIIGGVYGGGDVANVGPTGSTGVTATTVDSTATFTSTVRIYGGSTLSQVFAGGKGRTAAVCHDYTKLGGICGNARFVVNDGAEGATPYLWNRVYGGGQNGTIFGNTLVEIEGGSIGYNVFGGGWGDKNDNENDNDNDNRRMTYADVTGNTHVRVTGGEAKLSAYWNPDTRSWVSAVNYESKWYSPQYDPEHRKFLINHNIYGGGNVACRVGETHVEMTKGLLRKTTQVKSDDDTSGDYSFFHKDEWHEVYDKTGSPHFSVFGGGYGDSTFVNGDTYVKVEMEQVSQAIAEDDAVSDPTKLYSHMAGGQTVMDVVGGGYQGTVKGATHITIAGETFARRIYGGGFYAPVGGANTKIVSVDCNEVFGGGIMGDVKGDATTTIGHKDGEAGTNRNASIWIHSNIYGGNDVSGDVTGTAYLRLYGGHTLGDVYGAGNGNYLYALGIAGENTVTVNEDYVRDGESYNLVYTVPMRAEMASPKSASAAQKLVNINSFRPTAHHTDIILSGNSATDTVSVKGNVFGGGNTATVSGDNASVHFEVGNHVHIGGMYLGSDGDAMFRQDSTSTYLTDFQLLNNINLQDTVDWMTDPANHGISTSWLPVAKDDRPKVYPHLLDLYFQPVEMALQPTVIFNLESTPAEADTRIGVFVCGGNRGNMNVAPNAEGRVIDITFPAGLTIGKRIVGGCNNANYRYDNPQTGKTTRHIGGYLLGDRVGENPETSLNVQCAFEENAKVYGGCYETGNVNGDIRIDYTSNAPTVNIYGAGFGMDSYVYGNTALRIGKGSITTALNYGFGGGEQGNVIGNSDVRVYNGHITKSVTGGSYSGYLWGSTQVMVGYPEYYTAKKSGIYRIHRVDKAEDNTALLNRMANGTKTPTIKQTISIMAGDIVSTCVVDSIFGLSGSSEEYSKAACFEHHNADTPDGGWDNIDITLGEAVYGGGYSLLSGASVTAGNTTVLRYTSNYNLDDELTDEQLEPLEGNTSVGYGGNTTVLIWDATSKKGSVDKDHISISSQSMNRVTGLASDADVFGYYYKDREGNYRYIYQEGQYTLGGMDSKHPEEAKEEDGHYYIYSYDGEGGVFGDGHLSYAEGFRCAELQGYGYAGHTPDQAKILNTFQRLDMLRLTDNCLVLLGARDYTVNEISTTPYSISRVGEIQMISSISDAGTIAAPDTYRTRNYMGLSNNIHYVGAISSSVDFESKWHDENGALGTGKKNKSYRQVKEMYIDAYYQPDHKTVRPDGNLDEFNRRNDGTAVNMIGISSGYALKIQNVAETYTTETSVKDSIYYGPIEGVVEMKLIDVREDEGGGYVYADNIHRRRHPIEEQTIPGDTDDSRQAPRRDGGADPEEEPETFLETTGNFVFPYNATDNRHIVDDCFPAPYSTRGTKTAEENADIHYWYVTGYNYFYNAHITGYTYNSSGSRLEFKLDNGDNLMTLAGAKAGQVPTVYSVSWRSGHDGYACDLEDRNVYRETNPDMDHSGNPIVSKRKYTQAEVDTVKKYNPESTITIDSDTIVHGYNLGISAAKHGEYSESDAAWYRIPFSGQAHDDDKEILMQGALPESLTADASIAIRLTDQVDNSTTQYYEDHLSKSCKATIILILKALEADGKTQSTGYIRLPMIYTKNSSGEFEKVNGSIQNTEANNDKYYCYNSVLNRFSLMEKFSAELYTKDGEDYRNVSTGSTIEVGESSAVTYYYKTEREYTYTIYLTIDYVQGPSVDGNITIQNCALPGEMVRLSTEDVVITSDQALAPNAYYWRIGKRKQVGEDMVFEDDNPWAVTDTENPRGYDTYKVGSASKKGLFGGCVYNETEGTLDVPAYYFMNGYGVQFGFTCNGIENLLPVPMRTMDSLIVHNYHRMDPHSTSGDVRLHLSEALARSAAAGDPLPRPRIYLEDERDLLAFRDSVNRGLANFAQAEVFLRADITSSTYTTPTQVFPGTFHGDGHVITLTTGQSLFSGLSSEETESHVHNLGVVGGTIYGGESGTDNKHLHCCYSYTGTNKIAYGINGEAKTDYTDTQWRYGDVAYNLNGYYLAARRALHNDDGTLRSPVPTIDQIDSTGYLRGYYRNGDYRYAGYASSSVNSDTYEKTGVRYLRRAHYPGYGTASTQHDIGHTLDVRAHMTPTADPEQPAVFDGYFEPMYSDTLQDYIFFGQDLRIGSTAERPSAIASRRAVRATNRVFRAAGYYRSGVDSLYHFNALRYGDMAIPTAVRRPNTTAIDFTVDHSREVTFLEADLPTSYASFATADNITRNLLVYTAANDPAVSYEAYDVVRTALAYDTQTAESSIRGHHIAAAESGWTTQWFHLVDKEDFHAPHAFTVTDRAWYERRPEAYSVYGGVRNWDGIVLPFRPNRVSASARGEITHFYLDPDGKSYASDEDKAKGVGYSGHEYWLRGLHAFEDDRLSFALPSREGKEGGFVSDSAEYADYRYQPNSWYSTTFSRYSATHTIYDIERTMEGYPYLASATPYIVRFPGDGYREFDFEQYGDHTITFACTPDPDVSADRACVVPVTNTAALVTTVGTGGDMRRHVGTYLRIKPSTETDYVVDNGTNSTSFRRATVSDEVLPFRTYTTAPVADAPQRMVIIEPGNTDPQSPEDPGLEGAEISPTMTLWYADGTLYVHATAPGTIDVYTLTGIRLLTAEVPEGTTAFAFPYPQGLYVANKTKFIVR